MMCSRFLWAPCTFWAKYAWSTFWALFNDFCNKSSGCSAVYAADVWSDDLLGIQQHVRPVPYMSPTCSTQIFKISLKYFLVFVLIFVLVFLEDFGAARAGCHICHWLVSHNSATNVFLFFHLDPLHQFKFYILIIFIQESEHCCSIFKLDLSGREFEFVCE